MTYNDATNAMIRQDNLIMAVGESSELPTGLSTISRLLDCLYGGLQQASPPVDLMPTPKAEVVGLV